MSNWLLPNISSYTHFVLAWGAIAIISTICMHWLKVMPMSSKTNGGAMAALGHIDKRTGRIIMGIPILVVVLATYFTFTKSINASIIFIALFVFHYIYRSLIYPFRVKIDGKKMPIASMLSSITFYIINGYLIGYYFGHLQPYDWTWLQTPQFIIGFCLFFIGFYINFTSDNILINLRKDGSSGYKIPHGGLYRYISAPHYFGEMIEWLGFAIMCWCLPATVYFLWVALPLIPQAIQGHHWYLEKFKTEYPKNRKAVFPYLL